MRSGYFTVECPRCGTVHETYFHEHHTFDDARCDECIVLPYENGQEVFYKDGTIRTVLDYDDNLCGEGCCSGYHLTGFEENEYCSPLEVLGIFNKKTK